MDKECLFTIDEIRENTRRILKEMNKSWNEVQIDILVQGVENSDWLKVNEGIDALEGEIQEWIVMLENELKKNCLDSACDFNDLSYNYNRRG
jgi:hypothetical protein